MNRLQALFLALLLLATRARCDFEGGPSSASESDLSDNAVADTSTIHGENSHDADMMAAETEAEQQFDDAEADHEIDETMEEEDAEEPEGEEGEEPVEEGEAEAEPDLAHVSLIEGQMLNPYDPKDHMTKFFGISKALKRYEDTYINCFDELPDPDFIQSELDKCTGVRFIHVHNALDYERRKVVAWADKSMHKVMIDFCYEQAAEDETMSQACDLFKEDLLLLLWNDMPMHTLLEMHKVKYTRDRASMPPHILDELLGRVADVEEEYQSLIDEVELHRENTINKIKTYIRRRIEDVQDRFNRGEYGKYPKMKKDLIEWTERLVETPDYTLDMQAVGRKLVKETGHEGRAKGKTRNFQKAFVSDWTKGPERKLEKTKLMRPRGVKDDENVPQNLLERSAMAREHNKIDRFQFFGKHKG